MKRVYKQPMKKRMKKEKTFFYDIRNYKLAYFYGKSCGDFDLCQDEVMKLIDDGCYPKELVLEIALIPKKNKLSECDGDDWNDAPAIHNATGFYKYPKGTIFLKVVLGKEIELVEEI